MEPQRANFAALLAANPNYFGNLTELVTDAPEPQAAIAANTTYEELACVGFHPQLDLLEAVVLVHQSSGYSGGLCSGGSPEYVRFYVSYDGGATWQDQGLASFTAYDLPGDKPFEYAVSLAISPSKAFCWRENLPLVRAILSWNWAPPANTPGFTPVWGNVVDESIQIGPRRFFPLKDILQVAKVELAEEIAPGLDLETTVGAPQPKALSVGELHELYEKSDVPGHRYLLPELEKLQALPEDVAPPGRPGPKRAALVSDRSVGPEALEMPVPDGPLPGPFPPGPVPFPGPQPEGPLPVPFLPPFFELFKGLPIDFSAVIGAILETDGDTTFEELRCVGLNPNQDALHAVLTVKKSSGYSGGPCTAGSREYVAFWVDWGDGAGWTYAGTTSVVVHDFTSVPPDGIQYGVVLPVDLTGRRRPCANGPTTARVRAILSWATPPPPANADWVPTWGNREETLVHIKPGETVTPGELKLYLESVSNQPVCTVDLVTGYAAGEKPFGGAIVVTGFAPGAPDVNTPDANKVKYKVFATPLNSSGVPIGSPQQLTNSFAISVIDQTSPGGIPFQHSLTQELDTNGFYTFQEDMNSADGTWRLVQNRVLAVWPTLKPMTGLWRLHVEAERLGVPVPMGLLACPDGSTRTSVTVRLDEFEPTVGLTITGWSAGGTPPLNPAVECETFKKGRWIHGEYTVSDEHFGRLTLTVEPTGPANAGGPTSVDPTSRSYPIVPTTGETGEWKLNTQNMDPCGYIVRLWVQDRTIVSGDGSGWKNAASVGFCLKA